MRGTMRPQAVGLVWYRPESYAAVRAIMADAEKLPATHEKWLYRAQKAEQQIQRTGVATIRVHLDVHDFPAFCRARGLNLDAHGRNKYAAWVAAQMLQAQARGDA